VQRAHSDGSLSANGSIAAAVGSSSPDSRPATISRASSRRHAPVKSDLDVDGVELAARDVGIVRDADEDARFAPVRKLGRQLNRFAAEAH
jgi:hypothetical protein